MEGQEGGRSAEDRASDELLIQRLEEEKGPIRDWASLLEGMAPIKGIYLSTKDPVEPQHPLQLEVLPDAIRACSTLETLRLSCGTQAGHLWVETEDDREYPTKHAILPVLDALVETLQQGGGLREFEVNGKIYDPVVANAIGERLANVVKYGSKLEKFVFKPDFSAPPDSAAHICRAVEDSQSLRTLVLSEITMEGTTNALECLEKSLKVNTTLTCLDLSQSGGGIEGEGMQALFSILDTYTNLQELDLSLCLEDNINRNINLIMAAGNNRGLRTLRLGANPLFSNDLRAEHSWRHLLHNTTLTSLDLGGSQIGRAIGVRSLAQGLVETSTLTDLRIGGVDLDLEGVEYLCCVALLNNTSLATLNLYDNSIGTEGVEKMAMMLCQNSTLTDLHLPDINDESSLLLAKALADSNSSLRRLTLSRGDPGPACARAFADVLRRNKTLRDLQFDECDTGKLGEDGLVAIAEAFRERPEFLSRSIRLGGALAVPGVMQRLGIEQEKISGLHHRSNRGDEAVLEALKDGWRENLVAFAMGAHSERLGAESPMRGKFDHIVAMIGRCYWGYPSWY
mmetsp:Transcript_30407/g.59397  ORF Transcript_30407/g.59397 Transcript_30407/m.59397 type:complete len:568 (+) Transcript_30407:96-1799(+)